MKVKVSELQGAALDWAVAKCEGLDYWHPEIGSSQPDYSTDWAQGGPIIEREKIALSYDTERFGWVASFYAGDDVFGGTPLIAAMRCYVASKLGDEIEIPEELK
jgi:hypothetical protein